MIFFFTLSFLSSFLSGRERSIEIHFCSLIFLQGMALNPVALLDFISKHLADKGPRSKSSFNGTRLCRFADSGMFVRPASEQHSF